MPKYDKSKYEVSKDIPTKFAQVIPGLGIQHFNKEHLTDNDCKALLKAKSPYVKKLKAEAEYKEDKPEYKDIDAGTFPQ
jgi:hypothetical protein